VIDKDFLCRVCGLEFEERPWGDDGKCPTFEICPCCGVEAGYEDAHPDALIRFRDAWLAGGAQWSEPKERPEGWSLEEQLQRIGVAPR
jgi:hypothetical protein